MCGFIVLNWLNSERSMYVNIDKIVTMFPIPSDSGGTTIFTVDGESYAVEENLHYIFKLIDEAREELK